MDCNGNINLGNGVDCGKLQKKSIAIVFIDELLSNKKLIDDVVSKAKKENGFTNKASVEFGKHCTFIYKDENGNDVYRDDFIEGKTTCLITEYI